MSSKGKKSKQVPKKYSKKKILHQLQMLSMSNQELRQIIQQLIQRQEQQMLQLVTQHQAFTYILVNELGIDEQLIEQKLSEFYTENIEKHKEMIEAQMKQAEAEAEAQAQAVYEESQEYLKSQGIDVDKIMETYEEELEALENSEE